MESVATQTRPADDDRFDTLRMTGEIDALAAKHQGQEDVFRSAVAKLLKAELHKASEAAEAGLLKDRHGPRCAERVCFVQDEIIHMLFSAATRPLDRSPVPSGAERLAGGATRGH